MFDIVAVRSRSADCPIAARPIIELGVHPRSGTYIIAGYVQNGVVASSICKFGTEGSYARDALLELDIPVGDTQSSAFLAREQLSNQLLGQVS